MSLVRVKSITNLSKNLLRRMSHRLIPSIPTIVELAIFKRKIISFEYEGSQVYNPLNNKHRRIHGWITQRMGPSLCTRNIYRSIVLLSVTGSTSHFTNCKCPFGNIAGTFRISPQTLYVPPQRSFSVAQCPITSIYLTEVKVPFDSRKSRSRCPLGDFLSNGTRLIFLLSGINKE